LASLNIHLEKITMQKSRRLFFYFLSITVALVSFLIVTSVATVMAQDENDRTCAGVNIVFFPGGSPGGPFETVVYNGAVHAAEELGANVQYIWSDWDPQKMVTQLNEALATNPDGIAIMGHPGDEAYRGIVDQAEEQGTIITAMNVPLSDLQAQYGSNGFGYVGAFQYTAGHSLAEEAVRRFELGDGDRAMVWGLLSQAGRGERTRGVIEGLQEAGMEVDYLEIDSATNSDPSAGIATFAGYVSSHPDVKLVVTDHGNLTASLETLLTAANKGPDDIFTAGFDLSPATVAAIQGGWTDLVIDQQQYLQGYLPILQICLAKKYHFSGLTIDSGAGFASADNIDVLAPLVEQGVR
jgi:simple sugar transport system substrate-binding protein